MIVLRPLARLWQAAALALLTMVVGVSAFAAPASRVFEVTGVRVDVTAATAAAAREQALADGEAAAFRRLIERLTLPADRGLLPELTRHEITSLVREFSVAEEKVSPVRYLARLDFSFDADKIRRLLADSGIAYAATRSKPLLVLPVLRSAGATLLWDDPNPWRAAWAVRAQTLADGLVPVVVPLGDLADIAVVGAEQALAGEGQRFAQLSQRYRTGDTLIAQAVLERPSAGPAQLQVTVDRHRPAERDRVFARSFRIDPGDDLDGVFAAVVDAVVGRLEDDWKQDNLLRFDRLSVAAVVVPIATLEDWLAVRRRLGGVAVLERFDLVLLSRDQARVNLYYAGTPHQLMVALQQNDLVLTGDGADWRLGLATGVRPDAG